MSGKTVKLSKKFIDNKKSALEELKKLKEEDPLDTEKIFLCLSKLLQTFNSEIDR